jgi:CubicO group peptidase (beta-lactamase class C family)
MSTKETAIAAIAPELDALAAESMAEWKVPGLAIAVVHDGEVALLKGYGQRDVEAGLPVTTDTQFTICSITKTFTATGLALLVDEGRLDWTKPVRDYVPEFRLHDPIATDRITVRDLLCHHSGLPRHDWVWMPGDTTPKQMLLALRHIEPSRDLRTAWQYSNLGYNAASIVTERTSGLSWEEFTRTRLAEPLGMPVTFTAEDLATAENAAVPYSTHRDPASAVQALAHPCDGRRSDQHVDRSHRQLDDLPAGRRRVQGRAAPVGGARSRAADAARSRLRAGVRRVRP